jgi:dihydrolipoamide dehydrogenase
MCSVIVGIRNAPDQNEDWTFMQTFDVIVIGAGPAGEVAAGRLGDRGLSVAIVEDRLVGGECSYWACMPSKALLRPDEALREVRRIPGAAQAVKGELDVQAVLDRRDEVIHDLDDSAQLAWLEERSIALFRGRAAVAGERRVEVAGEVLEARRAVIVATGSHAFIPPIEGLREAEPWTNVQVTTASSVPARLVILGGGVVGAEMAQAYSSLGTAVTVVERADRILLKEEPFASEQVAEALRGRGVDIRCGVAAERVSRAGGVVTVELADGSSLEGDELLVAIGRRPNTDVVEGLGFEAGKYLPVDSRCRVEGFDEWLYAIGDVNGRVLLTHMGKYQARLVADLITGDDRFVAHAADGPASPRVTFTDPQVAAVGMTEAAAREAGIDVAVFAATTSGNAGGSFYGRDAPGKAQIVVDVQRGVIVGATITGAEVADFLQAATMAVVAELPLSVLRHVVPPFPTRSELWLWLLERAGA